MHVVLSFAAITALSSLAYAQGKVCNNAAALCDRSYGNITHLGAHDSFSVRNASNSWTPAADQFYSTLQQLDAGVRLVTAQVHLSSGGDSTTNSLSGLGSGAVNVYGQNEPKVQSGATNVATAVASGAQGAASTVASGASSALNAVGDAFGGLKEKRQNGATGTDLAMWRLCHSNCLLYDGGSLLDWLSGIKGWLDAHPDDVVTVVLVNSDNADAPTLNSIFTAANITNYAYTPPNAQSAPKAWPTLNDLIAQDKRLMVFIADLAPASNTVAPYLMNEFTFIFENNYDNVHPTDFSCQPNRPSTLENNIPLALQSNYLPFMNHFRYDNTNGIEIPSVENVQTTNAASGGAGNLGDAAANCTAAWHRAPAFILVDFYFVGTPLGVVDSLNGVAGQTTGRLAVPDTVAEATATPSPTAYQGADGVVNAAAASYTGAAARAVRGGAVGFSSALVAGAVTTAACGVFTALFGLA